MLLRHMEVAEMAVGDLGSIDINRTKTKIVHLRLFRLKCLPGGTNAEQGPSL